MALIKCDECGSEVSSKAISCPKCGARVGLMQSAWKGELSGQVRWKGIGLFFAGVFGVVALIAMLGQLAGERYLEETADDVSAESTNAIASADHAETESSSKVESSATRTAIIEISALQGEWVGDVFGAMADPTESMALHHRILLLRGKMKNTSNEALIKVTCPARLTVEFENGRSFEVSAEDVCGNKALMDAGAALGMGDMREISSLALGPGIEREFGFDKEVATVIAKADNWLAFDGKYHSYPVKSTVLTIDYIGETAFGDPVQGIVLKREILAPSETAPFSII